MLDVRLFADPSFVGAQIGALSLSAAMFSIFLPVGIAGPARAAFVSGLHDLLLAAAAVAFSGAVLCAILLRDFHVRHGTPRMAPDLPSRDS